MADGYLRGKNKCCLTANHFRQLDRRSAHLKTSKGTGIILSKIFFATSKLIDRDHLFESILLTKMIDAKSNHTSQHLCSRRLETSIRISTCLRDVVVVNFRSVRNLNR